MTTKSGQVDPANKFALVIEGISGTWLFQFSNPDNKAGYAQFSIHRRATRRKGGFYDRVAKPISQ